MHLRNGAGPATSTALTGPGSDCSFDGEHLDLTQAHLQLQVADGAVRPVDPVIVMVASVGRGRFRASFDGRVLVESSSTLFLDAARVLVCEGIDGTTNTPTNGTTKIVMSHQRQGYDALVSTVGAEASPHLSGALAAPEASHGKGGDDERANWD